VNYIFLLLGNDSFYESIIMSKLVEDMPESAGIFCITGQLQTVYFNDNQKIFKIPMGSDMAENKKLFDDLINEGEISAIFILDFYKIFFKTLRPIIQFNLSWLENLTIPVCLIDYLDIFAYNEMDQLYLKHSRNFNDNPRPESETEDVYVSEDEYLQERLQDPSVPAGTDEEENPREDFVYRKQLWPVIIKLSPPYPTPEENESDKIFFWKSSAKNFQTFELEQMKGPLGITEDKKNVVIMFSYQMILQSIFENKQGHYMRIVNTLILYLKKLDIELNLFIVGYDTSQDLVKGSKIKLRSFKVLNHGLYKTLVSFANLIIVDTPWHPILLDAAELQIPAGVIGNSLKVLEDGSMVSDYESTDLDVFHELEKAIIETPNIFFPYIAYPLKVSEDPDFTYYEKKFMYYLLDIYNDETVIPFLGEFLISDDPEVSDNLKKRQDLYIQRADEALSTEEMLMLFED
jgi:hypothetical protein